MARWFTTMRPGEIVHPVGFGVKIEVEEIAETTEGGIVVCADLSKISNDNDKKVQKRGATRGTIVEVGEYAGKSPGHTPEGDSAIIGRVVTFQRYEGNFYEYPDGKSFIIINDTDIDGWIE